VDVDAVNSLKDGKNTTAEILFDTSSDRSRNARGRLWDVLNKFIEKEVARRLANKGLDRETLNPMEGSQVDVASKEDTSGFVLGMILPYIVIIMASVGGMTTAFDTCAGEKERGTMETLLVSPASRHEIVLGKLWTISTVSIAAAFFAVCGIVLAFQGVVLVAAEFAPDLGVSVSYTAVAAMLVFVVPLSLMTSSLLLVVSAFARNQKEAQAYVFPFMILVMLPALLSNFISQDPSFGFSLVPILNTALVMKKVLVGTFDWPFLCTAIISSGVYAALTMKVATAMFEKESVLFRA
jgi:sodium transport system permease protein